MYKDNYLYHMNEKDYFKYNNRQFLIFMATCNIYKHIILRKKLIYLLSDQYLG